VVPDQHVRCRTAEPPGGPRCRCVRASPGCASVWLAWANWPGGGPLSSAGAGMMTRCERENGEDGSWRVCPEACSAHARARASARGARRRRARVRACTARACAGRGRGRRARARARVRRVRAPARASCAVRPCSACSAGRAHAPCLTDPSPLEMLRQTGSTHPLPNERATVCGKFSHGATDNSRSPRPGFGCP